MTTPRAPLNSRLLPLAHLNGIRSVDEPCVEFVNGTPGGNCETDGHYLCEECSRRASCTVCGLRPVRCECRVSPTRKEHK